MEAERMHGEAWYMGYRKPERRGRAGGLASGRKRRQLSLATRRPRTRQQEAALAYDIQQVGLGKFRALFVAEQTREGIQLSERGLKTLWCLYRTDFNAYRGKGRLQGFTTTNDRRVIAMRKARRPRCERTIRRGHRKLEKMGLLRAHHNRKGGSRRGNRDCLRIEFTPSFVRLPAAATTPAGSKASAVCVVASSAFGRTDSSSDCPADGRRGRGPAPPGSDRPPDGGEMERRPSPANGNGSDKEAAPPAWLITRADGDIEEARRLWSRR